MKSTIKKILVRVAITSLFLILVTINYNIASSYSFNFVGPSTANNGDTVTLTITGNGLTGKVNLSANNATLSNSSVWVEKNSVSITAKIIGFPATITATPNELTDNDYNIVSVVSKTVTINEKVKPTPIPTPKPPEEPKNTPIPTQKPPSSQQTNPPPVINNSQGANQSKPNQTTTSSTTGKQSPSGESNFQGQTQNIENTTSSNNYLKSISINKGQLSPNFDRENLEYKVENINEDEIEITAEAEDERATISGTGTIALINGENIINITVTAENQSVRVYQIHINKNEEIIQSDLRLQTLEVKKINEEGNFYDIDIGFDKNKFEYVINVESDISDLDIIPTVEKEGTIVETDGKNNLTEGENNINITLTNAEDETKTTIYNIKVIKAEKPVVEISTIPRRKTWIWIPVIGIVIALGIIIGMTYHMKKRKNNI